MTKDLNHVLFWEPKWPRNWASEADIQHTFQSSSKCKPKLMWNQWKIFEKINKDQNFYSFWGPKWLKIGHLRPIFSTHLKVIAMSMYSNTDVKPVKTFWENSPEFWLTLGSKMAPKLGLWGPYSTHCWKYLQWACGTILMWNHWKHFEKVTKVQNFCLLWGPKCPKDEVHIHISESSSNEHIKQDWCESRGNFSTKSQKPEFWLFWRPKMALKVWLLELIFYTPTKVTPTSLEIKFHVNPVETFQENRRKPIYCPILALFGAKNGPKIWPTGAIFHTHTHVKVPTFCL